MGIQRTIRLAIVATHPIQHFVPFYRRLAQDAQLALRVFFMSDFSVRGSFDILMNTNIAWNMDLLAGYESLVLPEASKINTTGSIVLNNPSIAAALSDFDPDVVLSYGYSNITQWRVMHWCLKSRVPQIMISDSELLRRRNSFRKVIKAVVLPPLFARYAAFLTAGDNNEAYLRAYGVPTAKMFRCPFTIDENLYIDARRQRVAARARFRASVGISDATFLAISVGKLNPGKRPMDVVNVARFLKSKRAGSAQLVQFAIAGDGALRAELERRISSERLPVHMLGFVNVDHLADVYCGADAILHLSEADAHPLALSEAACIGLPLIVSDKVGAIGSTDIAREGENAIVTPCGDVEAIAEAVRRLANDPQLHRRMSKASVRIYSELDMSRSVAGLKAAVAYSRAGSEKSVRPQTESHESRPMAGS